MGIRPHLARHACRARRGLDRLWGSRPGTARSQDIDTSVRAAGMAALAPACGGRAGSVGGIPPRSRAWRESAGSRAVPDSFRVSPPMSGSSRSGCCSVAPASASRSWGIRSRASAARGSTTAPTGERIRSGIPSDLQFLRANRRLGPRRLAAAPVRRIPACAPRWGSAAASTDRLRARASAQAHGRGPRPGKPARDAEADCLDWGARHARRCCGERPRDPDPPRRLGRLRDAQRERRELSCSRDGRVCATVAHSSHRLRAARRLPSPWSVDGGMPPIWLLAGEPHAIELGLAEDTEHINAGGHGPSYNVQRFGLEVTAFGVLTGRNRSRHGSPGPDRGQHVRVRRPASRSGMGECRLRPGEHPAGQRAGRPRDATGLVGVDRSRATCGRTGTAGAEPRPTRRTGLACRLCRGPQAPGWPPLAPAALGG